MASLTFSPLTDCRTDMPAKPVDQSRKRLAIRRWIGRAFFLFGVIFLFWISNGYRTQGVPKETLQNSRSVVVLNRAESIEFSPVEPLHKSGLIFFCGSGVAAEAYAPLLRPLAEDGHRVVIIRLPYRFAPFESHREIAVDRAREIIRNDRETERWVIAGHSLGGALACRLIGPNSPSTIAVALIGTTHPNRNDFSGIKVPITKVYGTYDGIALRDRIMANKHLLSPETR